MKPRPSASQVETLLDTFTNIRDDEEHAATMAQCQDPDALVGSPNAEAAIAAAAAAAAVVAAPARGGHAREAGDVGIVATDAEKRAGRRPRRDRSPSGR